MGTFVGEMFTLPIEEFNLTTKMNRATTFQYARLETEIENIATRLDLTKQKDSEIEVLKNNLEDLIVDITTMEKNVNMLDQYSRALEEKIRKNFKK
jgi:chaperonin cofactor prefoldin